MFKSADIWLPALLRRKVPTLGGRKVQVLLAVCDHFEPFHQSGGNRDIAIERMQRWVGRFPFVQGAGAGEDGRPPVHTFFYPCEQYDPGVVDLLEKLCNNGAGETEIHLHHGEDSYQSFVDQIETGKEDFSRHGLLPKDPRGTKRYAFIHGNWAITNSHPEGKHCGVPNEIKALLDTGCYADLTMPSAPDPCQSRIVNSIYHAQDVASSRSHDTGILAKAGQVPPSNHLLFIQGPLALNWGRRKFGILPRLENADLTLANPPTLQRFKLWQDTAVHIEGKRDWVFIKLHTHGCNPKNIEMHLGEDLLQFYSEVSNYCKQSDKSDLYFVTAREMANIALAAMEGKDGNPSQYRDYYYKLG